MTKKKWTKKELDEFKKKILSKKLVVSDEMEELKKRADEMLKESTSNALYSSHMADAMRYALYSFVTSNSTF